MEGRLVDRDVQSLVGQPVPSLQLDSTEGPVDLADLAAGLLVLFLYPHATGRPDEPVPGWDSIPGARGCTAQSCAFRDAHGRFADLGATLAGLSAQAASEQREFATRVGLHYRLVADPRLELADALGLPTFAASGRSFYTRLTLVARARTLERVFFPVTRPEENAADVLAWLERR